MNQNIKNAVEEYQCSGCVCGGNTSCYDKTKDGVQCDKHVAGTTVIPIGTIFLGMPKGFCRIGDVRDFNLQIYETFENHQLLWEFDKYNIPVWKYKTEDGHVVVKGLMPRINKPFLHVILEDCIDKIDCYEITENDLECMD